MSKNKFQKVNINLPGDTMEQIKHMGKLTNIKDVTTLIVNSIDLHHYVLEINLIYGRKVVIERKNRKRNVLSPDISSETIKLPQNTIKKIREIENMTNIDLATHTIVDAVAMMEKVIVGIKSEDTEVFVEHKDGKRDDLTIVIK